MKRVKRGRPIYWPKPDEHRVWLEWKRRQQDRMEYVDVNGDLRVATLDHSRCAPFVRGG